MNNLIIERPWVIECSRCANDHASYGTTEAEARDEFAKSGWTNGRPGQFCPLCNGVER
jgi:hypothetical protein